VEAVLSGCGPRGAAAAAGVDQGRVCAWVVLSGAGRDVVAAGDAALVREALAAGNDMTSE
jgi:hypothetical protein